MLILVCQLAFAGSGNLFLCLCQDEQHPQACEAELASEGGCCLALQAAAPEDSHHCIDLLIEASELDVVTNAAAAQLKQPNLIFELPRHPELPKPCLAPLERTAYTRLPQDPGLAARGIPTTVQLLL
ncbi:hypothetical protein QEH54_19595 [Pelagicoccus sp. SDUM812003]|nr:hypothetical protein [Pelagicoccus sp. SDUM812003]